MRGLLGRATAYGALAGAAQVVALQANLALLEPVLRPAAFVEFVLLLLVSTVLPRGEPRPLGLMTPAFHGLAMPLTHALFVGLCAVMGFAVGRIGARSRA